MKNFPSHATRAFAVHPLPTFAKFQVQRPITHRVPFHYGWAGFSPSIIAKGTYLPPKKGRRRVHSTKTAKPGKAWSGRKVARFSKSARECSSPERCTFTAAAAIAPLRLEK